MLNTRGLDLTSTDIIKAEAMNDLLESQYKVFESKWKNLENKSHSLNTSFESLFRYYITMHKPDTIKGTNNEYIKKLWKDKDKWEAIKEFEEFTNCYEYILNLKDAYIWCLRHLLIMGKNAYTWIPVLVTMKFYDYSDLDIKEVAKFLTKWHWLHLINGYTIEKIKAFNFSIIKIINSKSPLHNILNLNPRIITNDGKNIDSLCESLCKELRKMNFYMMKWGKPFLYFMHNKSFLSKMPDEIVNIEFSDLHSTIEHIYPQNPKKGEWLECSENFKNILGNLTLLPRKDNAKAGRDMDKKIEIYNKFMYTPQFSKESPWSDEKIKLRTEELIKDFCKYIDINYYEEN